MCGNTFLEWDGHIGLCPGCNTDLLKNIDAQQRAGAAFDRSFLTYSTAAQVWLLRKGFRGPLTPDIQAQIDGYARANQHQQQRQAMPPCLQSLQQRQPILMPQHNSTPLPGPSTSRSFDAQQQHRTPGPQMSRPSLERRSSHVTPVAMNTPPTQFQSPSHPTLLGAWAGDRSHSPSHRPQMAGSAPYASHTRPTHIPGNTLPARFPTHWHAAHAPIHPTPQLGGNNAQLAALQAQKRHEHERAQHSPRVGSANAAPGRIVKSGRMKCALCKKDKPISRDRNDGMYCTPCFKDLCKQGDKLQTIAELEKQQASRPQTPSPAPGAPAPTIAQPQTPVNASRVMASPGTSSSSSTMPSRSPPTSALFSQPRTPNQGSDAIITPDTTPNLGQTRPQKQQNDGPCTPTPIQHPNGTSTGQAIIVGPPSAPSSTTTATPRLRCSRKLAEALRDAGLVEVYKYVRGI
ncbi:hypothetical protein BST61_g11191 [Cercospora zeina]